MSIPFTLIQLIRWVKNYPNPPQTLVEPHAEALSFRQRLEACLLNGIVEHDYALPPPHVFDVVVAVGEQLYAAPRELPPLLSHPQPPADTPEGQLWARQSALWARADELLFEAIVKSLSAYLSKLPRFHPAPFTQPFLPSGSLMYDMIHPFREEPLKELGLTNALITRFNANTGVYSRNVPKAVETIWPHRYQGPPEQMADIYLRGTPLHTLFNVLVPYQPFSELNRCAHHWCLGPTRRGKTTFLRHIIKYDLDEIAKGNCSLVIIDSKPKGLPHEMRTLKRFAPGEDLDGRLIVIDSDQPFPLNPFTISNKSLAASIITYMIATDTSALQTGALTFFVDAVLASKNKSLETLLDYIRMDEKTRPDDFENFDDDLKKWWITTRLGLHSRTASGVEERLANFMRAHRGAPILKNLKADSWGLDLYKELHDGGKVLLVDTDHLRNDAVGTALMGRLIIALTENLAARRQGAAKPIWVVIDEASDYLGQNDPAFVQILIKAAGAKVGMTVAYQGRGFIDPKIEKVLDTNAEIQSQCEQRGTVDLTIEKRPMTLPIKKLEFEHEDQMDRPQYDAMREALKQKYPYKVVPNKPPGPRFDPTAEAD